VIRKIIRKSAMHLKSLGIKQPFLYKLVPVLAEIMKVPYPELNTRRENIAEIILAEEKGFMATLNSSEALFKDKFAGLSDQDNPQDTGDIVFQLFDTFGIPLELTEEWLKAQGFKSLPAVGSVVSRKLEEQKLRSKSQSAMKGEVFDIKELDLGVKETRFCGYHDCQARVKILKIIKDAKEVKKIATNDTAEIILDKTSFYPESGGQIGDTGELVKGKNVFAVLDTKKADKVIIHIGKVKAGSFKKNDLLTAKVDSVRRLAIARNHTATHLLQAALRKVLGVHVQQQGSLVAQERLRFDFTHFKDIEKTQLERIEEIVNGYVMNNLPLKVKEMPLALARKHGALAFFAEKYANKVRVVSVADVSQELCGGTHLDSTGQIGLFKIIQEGSVASGVRRIEAITGTAAYKAVKAEEDKLSQELEKRLTKIKELEKQLHSSKLSSVEASLDDLIKNSEEINGIRLISHIAANLDMNTLRRTVDLIKGKVNTNAFIAIGSGNNIDNVFLIFGATADLCARGIDAVKLIKEVAPEIGGSGGGRKDFAQAGGNQPQNLEAALKKLKTLLSQIKL